VRVWFSAKNTHKNMQTLSYLRAFDIYTKGGRAYLIYSFPREKEYFFRLKESTDFFSFIDTKGRLSISSFFRSAENPDTIKELSLSRISNEKSFLTYTKEDSHLRTHLYSALSSDGKKWKKTDAIPGIHSFGTIAPWYLFEKQYILYFGDSAIRIATSTDLKEWHIIPGSILKPRKGYFDQSTLRVARVLNVGDYIALFYFAKNKHKKLCLGVVLLDKQAPGRVVWRSESALWEQPDHWVTNKIHILGIVQTDENFVAYFKHGRGEIFAHTLRYDREVEFPYTKKKTQAKKEKKSPEKKKEDSPLVLKRFYDNPIIEPKRENHWEALATFNSAALCLDNKVHLIYRAQDHGGISVFGYASSTDGVHIEERSDTPVYFPHEVFETSKGKSTLHPYPVPSGGGWGGCEDPRLTQIDDTIYMIYIAFNGSQPPGVALTSIKVDDFLNKIWKWQTPRLISRPGQIQKNWVIFPEKINGKFAVLHSITPQVSIDYLDSLNPDDVLIDSYHTHQQYANKERWDNIVRGVGAPPLKTEYGWLILYHAMDFRDPNRYKVGAMLLDIDDPTRIIARCTEPILEPDEKYENEGLKNGVVYVCGAVIKDGTLFVYYGGADMFVAVASTPLQTFLEELLSSGKASFQNKK